VTPAPINLSLTDTVFIHALTDVKLVSTKTPLDNSFEVTYSYRVINTNDFAVKISAKYPVTLSQFQVKVFIYNKADFDSLYIKIYHQSFTFSNLAIGVGANIIQSYTAPYVPASTTDVLFGIQGFDFSLYESTGF